MNKDKKGVTQNAPKRLTIEDLKKIIGGLGSTAALIVEDPGGSKASPRFGED